MLRLLALGLACLLSLVALAPSAHAHACTVVPGTGPVAVGDETAGAEAEVGEQTLCLWTLPHFIFDYNLFTGTGLVATTVHVDTSLTGAPTRAVVSAAGEEVVVDQGWEHAVVVCAGARIWLTGGVPNPVLCGPLA